MMKRIMRIPGLERTSDLQGTPMVQFNSAHVAADGNSSVLHPDKEFTKGEPDIEITNDQHWWQMRMQGR